MTPDPRAVEAALGALFPAGVAVAVERVLPDIEAALWPEERAAVQGAVPRRVAEFAAGRRAARRVLASLGHPACALPSGPDRAAVWPLGLSGSIAHDDTLALAVARRGGPLGVDIEPDADLPHDLWPIICSANELSRLHNDTARQVRRVFCAKEAVFKAQPAQSRALFGFDVLEVTLAEPGFHAQFLTSVGAFRAGQTVSGRLATVEGVMIAGVAWER